MKIMKNEIVDIFLHVTALPKKNMKGVYKKIIIFLLRFRSFRLLRKKYGLVIANRVIGDLIFNIRIYGENIKMTDNDYFEYYIMYLRNKLYEPSLTLLFKNLIEENRSSTFVDIGAHYGYFSLIAGKWLGPEGKVISIEPGINFHKRLTNHISLNNLESSIKTFNLGLSGKDGFATMGGWNKRRTFMEENGEIALVTLDSLCEKENIQPDIIKIDVHGSEGNVLSGMTNVLENHVSHLFCELHEEKVMNGFTAGDIIKILENSGLNVFEFTNHRSETGGKIIPISSEFMSDYNDRVIYATRNKILNS